MIKSLIIVLLTSSMVVLNPALAKASLMTVQDVTQTNGTLSQQLVKKIDDPKVQKQLAKFGISPEEAKLRVAALSDREIRDLANSQQAGGDVVIISLTTILLIVIIVLLLR